MIGQFGVLIDKGMRWVPMNGKTPEQALGLSAVDSYGLCNDMTLHCAPRQATCLLNRVNGPAVVVLLRCSGLDRAEVPLVNGPALITTPGGMTADKVRYLRLCSTLTAHLEQPHRRKLFQPLDQDHLNSFDFDDGRGS